MGRSKNTRIGAVCVLRVIAEGERRLKIRVAQLQRETGQSITLKSIMKMTLNQRKDSGHYPDHLCIQVYENPWAAAPLVETFGIGPWDERFGVRDGCLKRVFVGSSLAALEAEELRRFPKIIIPDWRRMFGQLQGGAEGA